MYCRQHADDGMIDVRNKRCARAFCTNRPYCNVEGSKKAAYCRQHVEGHMVNVSSRRCSYGSCRKQTSFNDDGSKTATRCKQHAVGGMVNIRARRCSHDSCVEPPAWGVLTYSTATVCFRHKSDILGGPVINFKARCRVPNCSNVSRWGLDGKWPTHCCVHGPLEVGLVCTVGATGSNMSSHSPSYGAVKGPSFHVKTE